MQGILPHEKNGYKLLAVVLTRTVDITEEITVAFAEDSWALHEDITEGTDDGEEKTAEAIASDQESTPKKRRAETSCSASGSASDGEAPSGEGGRARKRSVRRARSESNSPTNGGVCSGEGRADARPPPRASRLAAGAPAHRRRGQNSANI